MGASGDIWQVRAEGLYLGQVTNNVFWYRQTTTGNVNDAQRFAEGFNFNKIGNFLGAQVNTFAWTSVTATNWTTGLEQFIHTMVGRVGSVSTSQGMPSFMAWGFRYNRTNPIYSSGSKRFAGVPESYVDGNTNFLPVEVGTAIEEALRTALTFDGSSAAPVVLVTQLNKQPLPSKMAQGPFTTWDVVTATFTGTTTQRTRKAP